MNIKRGKNVARAVAKKNGSKEARRRLEEQMQKIASRRLSRGEVNRHHTPKARDSSEGKNL
jgi:hypothetical protein